MNFIVTNPIIMILKAILNYFRLRRNYIANGIDKIPPELKKVLVAWYSPKKQKLNNYDVIESYAEDFTRLNYYEHRGTINRTSNKIVITESKTNTLNIIENLNASTNDIVIKVTGVSEELKLFVQDINSVRQYISKDGVYKFTNNVYQFFGFGINKIISGINVVIEQLPTSILKDYSGNKHDAYLYSFEGRLNSGVGIYAQDFTKWIFGSTINNNISTKHHNKIHIVKKNPNNYFGFTIGIQKANYYNKPYKLKFNFNKEIDDIKFSVVSTDGNLQSTQVYSVNINDGSVIDIPIISEEIFNNKEESNIYYDFGTYKDIEIDVELIANYPNQLCYDGKSYAVAYELPILTDYTIIADTNPFLKIFKPFIDKAANNYICKINKFLQMIEEENGLIDIETLLGKSIDNLIVSPVQEYPDMFKGVTIGNGKIRIGLPGINKDIVLDANDIETFKQSLVK